MPQAGNRAGKIAQRAQWPGSTLELRSETSEEPWASELPTVFTLNALKNSPHMGCQVDRSGLDRESKGQHSSHFMTHQSFAFY